MISKNALPVVLTLLCAPLWAQTTQPTARPAPEAGKVDKKDPEPAPSPFTGAKLDEKLYLHFADGAHEGKAQSVGEVIGKAKENDGKSLRVAGTIQSVCQKKGCWIRVNDGAGEEIFVKFKVYKYFVPLDAAGRQVVIEGTFKVKETSVDELRHYAEDAGKKEEAAKIVAPKREFTMMADGLAIQQPAPKKDAKDGKEKGGETPPAPAAGDKK